MQAWRPPAGSVVEVAPPPSVAQSVVNAPDIWVFPESTVTMVMDKRSTSPTFSLPAGTTVKSYFVHPRNLTGDALKGDVVFEEAVLGIIQINRRFNSSDSIFGAPATPYPSETGGGGTFLRG